MFNNPVLRWSILLAILLAIVLVPFALFGDPLEAWTNRFLLSAGEHPLWTATVLALLLLSDILLPVPSSIVSTAAGYVLGMVAGTATSLIGMTAGSLLGYWLGSHPGVSFARRVVGERELERTRTLYERFGAWLIVIARPVPVLAEVSAFVAGIAGMRIGRFVLFSLLSNLGISLAYAAVGAYAASVDSFLLAFAGAILLPAIGMLVARRSGV
jgi:uncharacterized membrane protein YdjX (TVP38/TMEM64 family)